MLDILFYRVFRLPANEVKMSKEIANKSRCLNCTQKFLQARSWQKNGVDKQKAKESFIMIFYVLCCILHVNLPISLELDQGHIHHDLHTVAEGHGQGHPGRRDDLCRRQGKDLPLEGGE